MGKFCKNCGNPMDDATKFCPKCGTNNETQQNYGGQPNYGTQPNYGVQPNPGVQTNYNTQGTTTSNDRRMNSAAIGSFVCSLIGLLIMTIPLGITAIISGIGGINRKKYFPNETGYGFAIAGIIIGIIEVCIMIYLLSTGKGFFASNFLN